MNQPLDYAIGKVMRSIPKPILDLVLNKTNQEYHTNNNINAWLVNEVICKYVIKDVNLVSGQIKTIPMRQAWIEETTPDHAGYAGDDGPWTIFRIPPEYRDNKPISHVLSAQFPYLTYQSSGIANADVASAGFTLVDAVENVLNSHTLANPRNHPVVTLLSGDLVKLTPSQYTRQNWLLSVRIAYDETFTNMHDSHLKWLAEMLINATKQIIYTSLIVDLDRAAVETGMDIGAIKSVIESYSDAEEKYNEAWKRFKGAANLDPEYRRRMYAYML